MHLFRVILPAPEIDAAAAFYQPLLGELPGERVTDGRHYFDCDGVLLACWDLLADGDPVNPGPNPGIVYLATDEPLDTVRERAVRAGAIPDPTRRDIGRRP